MIALDLCAKVCVTHRHYCVWPAPSVPGFSVAATAREVAGSTWRTTVTALLPRSFETCTSWGLVHKVHLCCHCYVFPSKYRYGLGSEYFEQALFSSCVYNLRKDESVIDPRYLSLPSNLMRSPSPTLAASMSFSKCFPIIPPSKAVMIWSKSTIYKSSYTTVQISSWALILLAPQSCSTAYSTIPLIATYGFAAAKKCSRDITIIPGIATDAFSTCDFTSCAITSTSIVEIDSSAFSGTATGFTCLSSTPSQSWFS